MAFKQRILKFSIKLQKGGTVEIEGARASAKIVKAGGVTRGTANISIWGLSLSRMNQLSTLGIKIALVPRNIVTVEAGDEEGTYVVFQGTIIDAYADYNTPADVPFRINAFITGYEAIASATPTSFQGGVDVNVAMKAVAEKMGLTFETNVPNGTILSNPYYPGSAVVQMQSIGKAANVNFIVDDHVLAIWPKDGARKQPTVQVNIDTGLISYPAFTQNGITVRTLFNPRVKFGGTVEIKSVIKPACGKWTVQTLDHDLNTLVPNGQWFSTLGCYQPGIPVVTS